MLAVFIFLVFLLTPFVFARPTEQERVQLWYAANNTWPPKWQNERESFKQAMIKREEELMLLPGANERWENFMQYTQSRLVPRFTERGFELIQTPPTIQTKLKTALDRALQNWENIRLEPKIDAVYTPLPSKFVDLHGLEWEVIRELKPLHEAWSGLALEPTSAYGLRLYQNGSSLVMHYDKVQTHVISAIVHVGHEYYDDDKPWPIEIEDHDGNLHAVNLEPGQMLFYESASCLHGRRELFFGKYYASIFVHYRPVDRSIWNYSIEDVIANVPPFWKRDIIEDKGNRWSGQGLTIDSMVTKGAAPRIVQGKRVDNIKQFYEMRRRNQPHSEL